MADFVIGFNNETVVVFIFDCWSWDGFGDGWPERGVG